MPSSTTAHQRLKYTILSAFPFSWLRLTPFALFTADAVGHILFGHPPSPAMARHDIQLSCRTRGGRAPSSSLLHPSFYEGTWLQHLLKVPSYLRCPRTRYLCFALYFGVSTDRSAEPFLFSLNAMGSIDPANQPCRGLLYSSRSLRPAQQHIFDGLALGNFHG